MTSRADAFEKVQCKRCLRTYPRKRKLPELPERMQDLWDYCSLACWQKGPPSRPASFRDATVVKG